MSATLDALDAHVRQAADWKARVRQRPWLYVGLAAVTGFLVAGGPGRLMSALTRGQPASVNQEQLRLAREEEERREQALKEAASATLVQRMAMRAAEVAGTALAAMIARKLSEEILRRRSA